MDQKLFMQQSDKILNSMSMEELRKCLHNIARKTPESKRGMFLQLLEDYSNQKSQEDNNKKYHYRRVIPDEKVEDMLKDIKEVFAKIENCQKCLSAQGYEDYSNGYWSSEWIWEYEDEEEIGRIIEDAVLFAYDCVNDCRYKEAAVIFKLVMDTPICAEDEWGGDSFELSLEEMVDERLVGINLKSLALHALYSEYQLQPANNRAKALYLYFSYPYFKDIHIEEVFSVGREELKDIDNFFESWIEWLMLKNGDLAARLLKEGILYSKGIKGLLEVARQGYKEHPSVYLAVLWEYEKVHDYEKMKEIGKEALDTLEADLKIRGEIAIKVAQASYCINDKELAIKCFYEAFYSNSTIPNYLRLFLDKEMAREYKMLAEKRIEKLRITDDYYKSGRFATIKNDIDKTEYKYLYFFAGHFNKVKNWCEEYQKPLGWSGNFIIHGINLMLLYLYAESNPRKASQEIIFRVSNKLGFNKSKNLVFFKENIIFENEVNVQKGEEIFWHIFCLWKKNYNISIYDIKLYVGWLETTIDKRVDGIVGGKYRNKYDDVALLVAALGEVKESLGSKTVKSTIINQYMKKYPRHSAFRRALKNYMD